MPRKARIDTPGALHHIIVRGIERRRIFYDDLDRENLECQYELKSKGYGFDWLVGRVALLLNLEPGDIVSAGKYLQRVKARSLLCYWGARELGMTTVALAEKVNLAQPTVSQAISRGQKIAEDLGLRFCDQINQ